MSASVLLYGATGYTGRIIAAEMRSRGLCPVLSGRSESKLAALAEPLGLPYRRARLDESGALDRALRDVHIVLHAAGPFSATAQPMVEACLRAGVHYLDISAEVRVIESLTAYDHHARARHIMIMPAAGFDVVPSDCLAAHVARQLPGSDQLTIALTGLGLMTRASFKTLIEAWSGGLARRDGVLTPVQLGSLRRDFDFGDGPQPSLNVNWGDLATAYYTTGVANIDTYCATNPMLESAVAASRSFGWALGLPPWQRWLKAAAEYMPEGPTMAQRATVRMAIVAEARRGTRCVRARLHTPEAYTFTGMTAAAIAQRVLNGDLEIGFQTPARVYGPDFVLSFPNVTREDLGAS